MIKNLDAKLLFADRACNTNKILFYIAERNIKAVISPKRKKLEQRDFNYKFNILSGIRSLLLNVDLASQSDILKRLMVSSLLFMLVVSLCICASFELFYEE